METINSMASSAAKAIWGDNGNNSSNNDNENQKPGTGDNTAATMSNETQGQEPISGKQGDTSKEAGDVAEAQSKGPTTEQPSTTGDTGFKAAQADVRDPDTNPTADPKKEEERKNVDDTGNLDASENPAKVDGPGPRPVEEVAKERGGDAGQSSGANDGSTGAAADTAAKEGEEEDGKNENKGSGEQYVKSSGLKADGGDFDATKPGAGREADRLMEEKGLANPAAAAAAGKQSEDSGASPSPDSKEKKSLKDKIKSKLHKN